MLKYPCEIRPSHIPGAGLGLFLLNPVSRGTVVIYPNQEHRTMGRREAQELPKDSIEYQSLIRWFGDTYTVDPEWSPESHLNHSFRPNCLWHLGFIFALQDLPAGAELTIDYRLLLGPEDEAGFQDAQTGEPVVGVPWEEKMAFSSGALAEMFAESVGRANISALQTIEISKMA